MESKCEMSKEGEENRNKVINRFEVFLGREQCTVCTLYHLFVLGSEYVQGVLYCFQGEAGTARNMNCFVLMCVPSKCKEYKRLNDAN